MKVIQKYIRNFKWTDRCRLHASKRENGTAAVQQLIDYTHVIPPSEAKVVICGGGMVGSSVAYHLVKNFGLKDVVLLEQGRLGSGTMWHSAGLLGQLKQSASETKICQYSLSLYKQMAAEGLPIGWKQSGSLSLARTKDRMISLRRLAAFAKAMNIDCRILTPEEAQDVCSLITINDLEGALWIPEDGVGNSFETCLSLATEAQKMGITVVENCGVEKILTDKNQEVRGVETNKGVISCNYFVNSGGFWARKIGRKSTPEVPVPMYPCEHHYLHTLASRSVDSNIPVIRDYDGHFYIREKQGGGFLAGGFEPISKPISMPELPKSFQPLPEDWDQFHVLLEQILHRIPALNDVDVDRLCNGIESYTPDCKWVLGEAPEIKNYFVATGMKSIGMEAAGGVGKVIADWIVNGEPQMDIWDLDIRRFVGLHNNRLFLRDRMKEVPGLHYRLNYPFRQFDTGRCLRMPPIYPKLKAAGAYFGQKMGFERPFYFAPDQHCCSDPLESAKVAHTNTYGKPPWYEYCRSEYQACRERVGLLDYSSFTKLELWSPGLEVVDTLQYLCSNDVDIPVGSIIHTGMQNDWGGYENDCSLVRLAENHYMMIAPTDQHTRCQIWIKRHLSPDSPVVLNDVTSMYTAICLMGPRSRDLMADLTNTSMNPKDFPFFTYKDIEVGLASGIRAMNLTHTGELGWVLYIPNEYALHVYEHVLEVGMKYGIQLAGYFAMRTLRIEKFYAFWGKDVDTTTTPFECGRAFRVKFNKGNFIGKEALMKQKEEGVRRRYIQLVLDDHDINDIWPWGGEPIHLNKKCVGFTTTTGYGFTLGKQVCLGFIQKVENGECQVITNDDILKNNFEVDIAGRLYQAKANIHSPNLSFVDLGYGSTYMATR